MASVDPDLEHDLAALRRWAARTAAVARLWIYGSRVRGGHRPDSDLDVAVEVRPLRGDQRALATWLCEAEGWRQELQPLLRHQLDLCRYGGEEETPKVGAGLRAGVWLVYEREG